MNDSTEKNPDRVTWQRQPTRLFTISLTLPSSIDLNLIDDWLKSVLEVEIESNADLTLQVEQSPRVLVAHLLWRYLLLIRMLLQSASIPAFDPGKIIKLGQEEPDKVEINSSKWVVTIAVVNIDHVPSKCYDIAIESAIQIAQWFMERSKTPKNIQILHNTIEKIVTHSLRKMVVAGKSTIPVLRTAHQLDIPFFHRGAGVYQLGWGSKSRQMDRSMTESDTAIGAKIANNKMWSANLLRMAGLPAPVHGVVTTEKDAVELAHQLGWPVVVKPVDCERGEGVAIGVVDVQQLSAAFETAKGLSKAKHVVIEREVAGVCCRLFVSEGHLLYAVKRMPKSVEGDGQRTVAELIHAANRVEECRPPRLRSEPFPSDTLAVEAITAAGHALETVPDEGVWIPLRKIESTLWGGHIVDVTQHVHPHNLDIALRAAELFGLNVSGVDIITTDIQVPWHENDAIINEVNLSPLLGGREISRAYLPAFFKRFIDGDGRIPIEVVVGNDTAMNLAKDRQKDLVDGGTKCYLSSHNMTLTDSCTEMFFSFQSIFSRCRALLMNRQVEVIIMVIQTDELLRAGLPVDQINKITAADGELTVWNNPAEKTPQHMYERLLALLKSRCLP